MLQAQLLDTRPGFLDDLTRAIEVLKRQRPMLLLLVVLACWGALPQVPGPGALWIPGHGQLQAGSLVLAWLPLTVRACFVAGSDRTLGSRELLVVARQTVRQGFELALRIGLAVLLATLATVLLSVGTSGMPDPARSALLAVPVLAVVVLATLAPAITAVTGVAAGALMASARFVARHPRQALPYLAGPVLVLGVGLYIRAAVTGAGLALVLTAASELVLLAFQGAVVGLVIRELPPVGARPPIRAVRAAVPLVLLGLVLVTLPSGLGYPRVEASLAGGGTTGSGTVVLADLANDTGYPLTVTQLDLGLSGPVPAGPDSSSGFEQYVRVDTATFPLVLRPGQRLTLYEVGACSTGKRPSVTVSMLDVTRVQSFGAAEPATC